MSLVKFGVDGPHRLPHTESKTMLSIPFSLGQSPRLVFPRRLPADMPWQVHLQGS